MMKIKVVLITLIIFMYEALLIDYAANNFSFAKNWFKVVHSMPVFSTNIEVVILVGQAPVILFILFLYLNKHKREERELIEKYGKNKNT